MAVWFGWFWAAFSRSWCSGISGYVSVFGTFGG